jgi:hypothetical protein
MVDIIARRFVYFQDNIWKNYFTKKGNGKLLANISNLQTAN